MLASVDYRTVFEPHLVWWPSTLALLLAAGAGYSAYLARENGQRTRGLLASVVAMGAAAWSIGAGVISAAEYFSFRHALASGATKVVEGTVDQLHPVAPGGHGAETLTVQGVRFSYTPAATGAAFHASSRYGGPIQAGGQVRIHYLASGKGDAFTENPILQLEIAK
jgi:hypothetical protein